MGGNKSAPFYPVRLIQGRKQRGCRVSAGEANSCKMGYLQLTGEESLGGCNKISFGQDLSQ